MRKRGVVLLSGGLDSTLACRILQEQGVEIEALNIKTQFSCCKDDAFGVAKKFGLKLTVLSVADDYLKLIEKPKYGVGKGINPCVDCRIYMFRMAKKFMEVIEASFVATGEILDQRPMSQRRHQLEWIEEDSGLQGRLLRPLSAKLLEPTMPEKNGIVDREKLYGFSGRSRKELIQLAEYYGIEDPPTPSTGCLLTEPEFAKKVRDLFRRTEHYERWHFETLKVGRHFRIQGVKVILGRDEEENKRLELLYRSGMSLLVPEDFKGPSVLVEGSLSESVKGKVVQAILHYSKRYDPMYVHIRIKDETGETVTPFYPERISEEELTESRVAG